MILSSLLLAICVISAQASVTGYISKNDEKRLLQSLTKGFTKLAPDDYSSPYFGIRGFNLLKTPLVKVLKMDGCKHLSNMFMRDSSPEDCFYALSAYSLLECEGKLHDDSTVNKLKEVVQSDKSTTSDFHYALETLRLLGVQFPNPAKISQLLQARLKEDDSLLSLGHALHAAALLGPNGKFMLDRVEDIVVQADEVDGKMLQWEGGLSLTGLLLTGLFKLPGAKPLTEAQAEKFANYLLTRRTVQSPRGIVALLESAGALSDSSVAPVSITIAGPPFVQSEKPDLTVQVTDLLGRPLKSPPTPVVAQSATRVADDVVVLSKQPFSPGANPSEFKLPLQLEPGQYRIALTAGSHSTSLTVKVLGPITLQSLEVGISDADGAAATRYFKVQYPSALAKTLQADSTQHLIARFSLPRAVHQTFLRLYSGKREIIFVAEKDHGQLYKVEVNLASEIGESGTFDIELIVGDSIMSNPIRWKLGAVELQLGYANEKQEVASKTPTRGPKPEIEHMFRPAEKRPPQVVSMMFTALAAAPILLLLILWFRIGINVSSFSMASIPFHLGLGLILGLFTLFWLRLDMFTTCAWLIPLGGFTFLAGNRLLRRIAKQKKH